MTNCPVTEQGQAWRYFLFLHVSEFLTFLSKGSGFATEQSLSLNLSFLIKTRFRQCHAVWYFQCSSFRMWVRFMGERKTTGRLNTIFRQAFLSWHVFFFSLNVEGLSWFLVIRHSWLKQCTGNWTSSCISNNSIMSDEKTNNDNFRLLFCGFCLSGKEA